MTKKSGTLAGKLRFLLVILIPLAFIYFSFSVWGTYRVRNQSIQYMSALINVYVGEIDEKIENINRRLGLLFLSGEEEAQDVNIYLNIINSTQNEAYRNYYISRLKRVFETYALEYGDGYHFFAYFPESNWYIDNHSDDLPVREYKAYEETIKSYFNHREEGVDFGSQYWKIYTDTDGRTCILKFYHMRNNYIGCWIRPEDLLVPLNEAVQNGRGSIFLYDKNKRIYTCIGDGEIPSTHVGQGSSVDLRQAVIETSFKNMPFYIRFLAANTGMFWTVLTTQMAMMAIALIMLGLVFSSVIYLYHRILIPIRKFSYNLEVIKNGGGHLEEITSDQLEELKKANGELAFLLRKINVLENEIQHQELEKQKIYLEYLKLQIRPHFYLNCLNFIYNMIDLGKWRVAQKTVRFTADYMRYLLKDNLGFVYLWEEIDHVRNYMEIQKLRFSNEFDYYIDQEETTRNVRVPHMLIQPFVENAMKYAVNLSYRTSITITIYSDQVENMPYANICISDTGPGFPEEYLEKLNLWISGKENPKPDTGIGIVNTITRIRYYYGEFGKVKLYNGNRKGAIIELQIPMNLQNSKPQGE